VRDHRHLFDNEQTACMEASKLHQSSFNHELLRSWSCKRRTVSIAVAFAGLERQLEVQHENHIHRCACSPLGILCQFGFV
jgi:hypothetical protein